MIELKNVSKAFGEKIIFSGCSLKFDSRPYCITAASGTGKTTLLNLIAGTLAPDGGEIIMNGINRVGMVWQEDRLCENINAVKNVALVCGKETPRAEIITLLEELGLKGSLDQPVSSLSGGQKRRTAIARALIL
ncbi:MAG: ATP-binding cassette domain-containing protein, partial [Clostridiales bacterium]|nr:ATP-binding cassette domain-containing protein [Clostridiales bacterium]